MDNSDLKIIEFSGNSNSAAEKLARFNPADYNKEISNDISDNLAFIDSITEITGLRCRQETVQLIKKHADMRNTFFTSKPIITNDLLQGLTADKDYFYTSEYTVNPDIGDDFKVTAVGTYQQYDEDGKSYQSRFGVFRRVFNENGVDKVLRYPIWMVDNKILSLLKETESQDIINDLQQLLRPAIHDMTVHSAIRDFDNDDINVADNPILRAWSDDIKGDCTDQVPLDQMITYEYFSTALHYQIIQKTFEMHPLLKNDYEEALNRVSTRISTASNKLIESGKPKEAEILSSYLSANISRAVGYVLPTQNKVFGDFLEQFPNSYEESRLSPLFDKITSVSGVPLRQNRNEEVCVVVLARLFFEGLKYEIYNEKPSKDELKGWVKEVLDGRSDIKCRNQIIQKYDNWIDGISCEISKGSEAWREAFKNPETTGMSK